MVEYLLFPGCTIQHRLPYLESASRKVFDRLGVELAGAAFSCCPDPCGFQSVDVKAWLALGAANLCLAEAAGKNVMSLCNGCTQTLKKVNHELEHDPAKKEWVNEVLAKVGKSFQGTCYVKHFLEVLVEDVGLDAIKAAVTKPLEGLNVATHPGCHYSRPHKVVQTEDPFEPKFLKQVVAAIGANVVEYDEERLCCGNGVVMTNEDAGIKLNLRKYKDIKQAGADCLCVICPACFQQFDTKQANIKKATGEDPEVPIFYLTELIALAFGEPAESLEFKNHRSKVASALSKISI